MIKLRGISKRSTKLRKGRLRANRYGDKCAPCVGDPSGGGPVGPATINVLGIEADNGDLFVFSLFDGVNDSAFLMES